MCNFIEKKSKDSFLLHLNVKPNSRKQEIINNDDNLTVKLRSKPVQNKANKELLNLLKKKLKISSTQIQIISGSKGTNKIISIEFSEDITEKEFFKKLFD